MKAIFIIFFALILVGCSTNKFANHQSKIFDLPVPARIQALINNTDPHVNIGIKIVSLDNAKVLYEQNADRHFVPASTIKLATVAAALYYLGPSYRFETNLFTESFDTTQGLINNLYLHGSGDPSLMDHDLIKLAHELKQQNINTIQGNIYIDDFVFDNNLWTPGTMWDDRKFAFSAPLAGINLNYNRLEIKTLPAHKAQTQAHVIVRPQTSYVSVSTRAQTTSEKSSKNLSLTIKNISEQKTWAPNNNDGLSFGDHIFIDGTIPSKAPPSYSLLAIKDPGLFAGTFLQEQLQRQGIKFTGKILRKKIPYDAIKIASHQSRALAEALIDFTKISLNLPNDALIKAIAAQAGEKPATFTGGLKLVGEFLSREVGIKDPMITVDGSGISRYNLITPNQMLKILLYAANNFSMGPEFLAAMPLAGQDGTLSARLMPLAGNIRAKTGTLANVSSLAGYYLGPRHQRFAFTIFINGFTGAAAKYAKLQDDILSALLPVKASEQRAFVRSY
jgi:D-alanyl-D-alanine carboxypeptidase/D-alanyl-D-alanine-endopeptidase (penicillin-binding protein 4)